MSVTDQDSGEQKVPPLGSQVLSFGISQVIQRLRGIVVFALLARLIGPFGYGLLAPLTALSGVVQFLVLLGVNTALTVLIPHETAPNRSRRFWGIFQITAVISAIVAIVLIGAFPTVQDLFLPPEMSFGIYFLGIVAIPVSSVQAILYAQIINNRQGVTFSRITAAVSVVEVILLVVATRLHGIRGALAVFLFAQAAISVLCAVVILRRDRFALINAAGLSELKPYYAYGLTMVVAGLAIWSIDSSDRLVLARVVNADELGVYAAAHNLCSQLNQLAAPMFAALMPYVSGAVGSGNFTLAKNYLGKTYRILLFIFVPATALMSILAEDLIAILATQQFSAGAVIVPFVAIGIALWQIGGVHSYNIYAHKRAVLILVAPVAGAVLNFGLNIAFAPRYGIMATAVSKCLSYGLAFGLNLYLSHRLMPLPSSRMFITKLTVISICTFVPTAFLASAFWNMNAVSRLTLVSLSAGSIYLGLAYLFSLFDPSEKAALTGSIRSYLKGGNA